MPLDHVIVTATASATRAVAPETNLPAIWEAIGVWVGAAASFTAAFVALWIAGRAERQEADRREAQRRARRMAVMTSLEHGLETLDGLIKQDFTKGGFPAASMLTGRLEGVLQAAKYALSQEFSSEYLLVTALNLQTIALNLSSGVDAISENVHGTMLVPNTPLAKLLKPLAGDVERTLAEVREMRESAEVVA